MMAWLIGAGAALIRLAGQQPVLGEDGVERKGDGIANSVMPSVKCMHTGRGRPLSR